MRLPPVLLALDILGTGLMGLGLFGLFASDPVVVAGFIDLGALAVPLIIIGGFLMAPLMVYLVKQATSGRR